MDNKLVIPLLATTSAAIASAFAVYYYQKNKRLGPPQKWQEIGKVIELYIYPLKSGKRVPVKRAECVKFAFKQTKEEEEAYQMKDRELVVYNERDLEFRTARTYPKMVLIEVRVHDEEHYAIDAPDMETLYVKIPKLGEAKELYVKYWRTEKIHALDCGDEAATWFSRYIKNENSGLRLGYHLGFYQRDIRTAHKNTLKFYPNLTNDSAGLFTDLAGGLIVNQNTVNDLNEKIDISVHNFRPSVIVDCPTFAEDSWNWIKIGDVVFQVIKPCTRCVLTTINPETGERRADGEPLKTLRAYRAVEDPELRALENNAPIMGVYVGIRKFGFLSRGDVVYVGVE